MITYIFQWMVRFDDGEHHGQIERSGQWAEQAALRGWEQLTHQQKRYATEPDREADHEHDQADDRQIPEAGVTDRV